MVNHHPCVAVVDDEASVLKAIGRLIRSAGIAVEVFASGADFLALAGEGRFDCVVLDVHMPDLSGLDVQCEMASRGIRTPVIVITGRDSAESRASALAGGADKYLLKPVDGGLLLDAIAEAIWNR